MNVISSPGGCFTHEDSGITRGKVGFERRKRAGIKPRPDQILTAERHNKEGKYYD
jgi:hypothetical protein